MMCHGLPCAYRVILFLYLSALSRRDGMSNMAWCRYCLCPLEEQLPQPTRVAEAIAAVNTNEHLPPRRTNLA